ncbi:MAG TPA: hypothetical protein VMI73_19860 [Trebonia sp.]|nr:hypothetical protein [Trebonia sp.]
MAALTSRSCRVLKRRYGDIVDRVTVPKSGGIPPEQLRDLMAGLG